MSVAARQFTTEQEVDAFLDAPDELLSAEQEQRRILEESNAAVRNPGMLPEPAEPSVVDIAPEDPTPLLQLERPLDGAIEPNVQAVLDANGEPPLPDDEPLPPVTGPEPGAAPTFATPEDVDAFLDAPDEAVAAPAAPAFSTPEEVDAFLDAEPETPKQAFEFTGPMGTVAVNGQQVAVGGKVTFDPARLAQGLQGAYDAGLISEEDYQAGIAAAPEIERVTKDREALLKKAREDEKLRASLEHRAGNNPEFLAALYGAGKGGAITAGAVGGAKAGAAAGTLVGGPVGAAVGGVVGGIGGGIGSGVMYDWVYEQLGRHFEEYDAVLAAAKLKPEWKTGAEIGMAALSLPVSAVQGAQGLAITADRARQLGQAVGPAVARQAGAAAGAGAATGMVAYPIDAAVRGEEITPGGFATAAGVGALGGGFFINNRPGTQRDLAAVAAKMRAGMKLSPVEEELARAAAPAMRAAFAEMDAAGGRRLRPTYDAEGNFVSNDPEVNVPMTSVMGFMPAAGRATVRLPYEVPLRLPQGAARAAETLAARRPVARPAGPAGPTGETAAAVPRTAPVNVLPTGEPIVPPPPMTPAMMTPDDFAVTVGAERGVDMDFNPDATTELFNEHFRIVRDAVNNNEPVSAAALDLYEMRVPYYVRDEATGLARFDQAEFDAWGKYVQGQEREASENMRQGGVDLLEAIRMAGGLPTAAKGKNKAVWGGELKRLQEMARGARDLGIKQARDLFRKDANDVDRVVMALQAEGFRVETEADLFELLEQRLRSGKPMFAYGDGRVGAGDEPMAGVARRGAAPRQMDLLGESDVEFTLTGQTDKTSLTPAELTAQAQAEAAKAEAEKGQGDLFGGSVSDSSPSRRGTPAPRDGGTAWLPPGVARPANTTTPRPDWVRATGETSEGRRLIKGIENYRIGQQWGFRSIVDFVNRATGVQMVVSKSQTSRNHPANYRPLNATYFTRQEQSQINFHEAAHHVETLIDAAAPGFWRAHQDELLAIAELPGSMASQPPANASDATKREYLIGEGVAEWMRLLMVDPPAVNDLKVTAAALEAAEKFYPKLAASIRDAARAVHRFQNQTDENQWSMGATQPDETITVNKVMQYALAKGNAAADTLASGAPFSRFGRRILRSILKNWNDSNALEGRAVDKMRQVRKLTDRIQFAHNYKLMVGAETSRAIRGEGLRMPDVNDKWQQLLDFSYEDAIRTVPAKQFRRFVLYGWAREALNRYEWFTARAQAARAKGDNEAAAENFAKARYPLIDEGFTPDRLRNVIKRAEAEIPNASVGFAKVQRYFDKLLDLKYRGGLKTKDEVERMTEREIYWPQPRVGTRTGTGTTSGGDVMVGDYTIKGSTSAYRDLNAVAIERTKQALDSHANNRLMRIMHDTSMAIAKDKNLPMVTRTMAGQWAVPLDVPSEMVVSAEQMKAQVQAAIEKHMEKQTGIKSKLKPEQVQILDALEFDGIWRTTKPNDANVISYMRDGKRVYLLTGDPAAFRYFSNKQVMDGIFKMWNYWLGPTAENTKRNITQSPEFAVFSLKRDLISQMVLNPDAIGWVPGGALVQGLWNKMFRKYPQLAQEGLLLSRVEPNEVEMLDNLQRNTVWKFLLEGAYVGTSKDPVERTLQTIFQPSNWFLYLGGQKITDIRNALTFGRFLAQLSETSPREGAAAAVLARGGSDLEAAMKYWTSSGQFNEHPLAANMRGLLRPMMFMNPAIQGMRNFMQVLTDPDPAVRATIAGRLIQIAAMGSMGAVAGYVWMSEEDKERERERPIEDRLGFASIGGFRIPFAYGPEGVVESLAYNAVMDYLLERPREAGWKEAQLIASRVFEVGSPLAIFGPQVTAYLETKANYSFFRQNHLEPSWMEALPEAERYRASTPRFYREVGQMFNFSPIKIQYFVQQAISRQTDDTIKLVDAMMGGRPVDLEKADYPFVGRLFVRDPLSFGAMSMRKVDEIDAKLRALDTKLGAKGWTALKEPIENPEMLPTKEMQALHRQLRALEMLRRGDKVIANWPSISGMDRYREESKYLSKAERWSDEKNVQAAMVRYAQSLLVANEDAINQIEAAMETLRQIPSGSPEQIAEDYRRRVR
jgi:hypothetical protein